MLIGLYGFCKDGGQFVFMQRPGQRFLQRVIPFVLLQEYGLVEQVPAVQVVEDKIEQIDVFDAQPGLPLGDMGEQKPDVLSDL